LPVSFQDLLTKHKSAILEDWLQSILDTYPPETARFLRQTKDGMANPVGATVKAETEHIFDELLAGDPKIQELSKFLDRIIRIRAVQDFTPDEALGFIFDLKQAVRRRLGKEMEDQAVRENLLRYEEKVDKLMLLGFSIYMSCREQIYELKAKEMRNLYAKVLERSGVFAVIPEQEEPDLA
jgi:hypothetical protein